MNEACGMSGGLADSERVAGFARDLLHDLQKRHELNRVIKIKTISIQEDITKFNMATITDAKSFYDNLMQDQYTGADNYAALEKSVLTVIALSLG